MIPKVVRINPYPWAFYLNWKVDTRTTGRSGATSGAVVDRHTSKAFMEAATTPRGVLPVNQWKVYGVCFLKLYVLKVFGKAWYGLVALMREAYKATPQYNLGLAMRTRVYL